MNALKIAIIEDEPEAISTFERSCKVYARKNTEYSIELIKCTNIAEFKSKLEDVINCDGIVIDMKLSSLDDDESGVTIIDFFAENKIIIPTIILTGTADVALDSHPLIDIKIKGKIEISEILDSFIQIKNTGIIDIIGGKGVIKNYLYNVFHKNIHKQKDSWFNHSQNDFEKTRNALLRHTINHLNQYIDEESNEYYLQEMYIYPPIAQKIKPGSILNNLKDNKDYIVLTPACDLAQEKAHCILLCEIISPKQLIATKVKGEGNSRPRQKTLKTLTANGNPNFHFLPPMFDFLGGFIDFASVISVSPKECSTGFSTTKIQISNSFISDIVARFSIYYSRQGQPALKHNEEYFADILEDTIYTGIDTSLTN